MRVRGTTALALCAIFGMALACPEPAEAAQKRHGAAGGRPTASVTSHIRPQHAAAPRRTAPRHAAAFRAGGRSRAGIAVASYGGISCVPYARMVTGMQISGNGGQWWHNAAGIYDRGQRPEPGAILAFPGSGGMSRGHVAVVSRVHGPRHIEIDHANWGGPGIPRGTVMRNVDVIDVSERNDWSLVRVQVGWEQGSFGRPYPTYGFIYNRPARSMMASFDGVSSAAARPVSTRFEEVAELPRTAPTRGAR